MSYSGYTASWRSERMPSGVGVSRVQDYLEGQSLL